MCIDSCYSEPREPRARCGWCNLTQTHRLIKIYIIFFFKNIASHVMQTDLRINASLSPENNGAKSQRGVNTSHRAVSFICRVLLWFDVIKMCCLVFKAPDCSLRPVKALRSHMCSSQRQWQTTRKFSPCQWTSCFLGVFFFLVCHVSTSLKRYDSHYFISLYLFRTKAAWYRGEKTDNAISFVSAKQIQKFHQIS